jgi:hypothetical protein
MAQVVECLLSKHTALSSNPGITKKERKKKKRLSKNALKMCS